MSSILKALQKLESETLEKGTGQSWLHHFTARKHSPEKKERNRGKYFFALLCGGLIILGSAAFVFLKTEPASITSVPESQPVQDTGNPAINNESARAEIHAEKAIGATGTDTIAIKTGQPPKIGITDGNEAPVRGITQNVENEGSARESAPAGGPGTLRDTKKSESASPEKPAGHPARMAEAASPAGHKKTDPRPNSLETSGPSLQPDAVESRDIALNTDREESELNPGIETVAESPEAIAAKKLQNPDIKLHAISWTTDVKTRIAVINGSIVREGDTVSSYKVYKINKDDIVLSKGGEFWRLAFRGR